MTRNFIYFKGNSRKYWSITVDRSTFTTSYGKVEYDPQTTTKKFPTEEQCRKEADKLIASKLKSKYEEVPLHIPNVPVWDMWTFVCARDKKEPELNISAHHSTEFTQLICGLTRLKDLTLTNLQELPPAIGQLTNLRSLDISSSNKLTRIPGEIGQLKKLKFLTISGTAIKSLPDSIGNLTEVLILSISSNPKLEQIPATMAQLTKLQSAYISYNRSIIDKKAKPLKIPPGIFQHMVKLKSLHLDCNALTTIPESLKHCRNMTRLYLESNKLTKVPEEVFELRKLTHLTVCDINNLSHLPQEFIRLKQLRYLAFDAEVLRDFPPKLLQQGLPAIREYLGIE